MANLPKNIVQNILKSYTESSLVPRPVWAWIIKENNESIKVESKWSFPDLQRRKKIFVARTYIVKFIDKNVHIGRAIHEITVNFTSYHSEDDVTAVLHIEEENSEEKQYLQIWKKMKQIFCLDVSKSKLHGKIHTSDSEKTFQWNGKHLLFLAEPKREVESFFKEPVESHSFELNDKMYNEFVYQENWGETMSNCVHPHLCYLDLQDFKIVVKDLHKDMTIKQAVWGPQESVVYVACNEMPYKCGRAFCTDDESSVFCCNIVDENSEVNNVFKENNSHVRSPRFSPDKNYLIFLQNNAYGSHRQCSQLILHDWLLKKNKILIDIVYDPKDDEFPGVFTEQLPERCFTSDGSHVIFSSNWHSTIKIIAVNITTGRISTISKDSIGSCMTVLDVFDDKIVAVAQSLDIEPFLVIGEINIHDNELNVVWHNLDNDAPQFVPDISFTVKPYIPSIENPMYPGLKCEAIFLRSKTLSSLDHSHPIILWPHGGPHASFTTSYLSDALTFVKLGFIVCMVNYRGSTGFGENSIRSLLGNVGSQDISDVKDALSEVKKWMEECGISRFGEVFVFGGSHGGFIGAHLCAQYPGEFKACALRNPVTHMAAQAFTTDIPNWCYVETGIPFHYQIPSLDDISAMFMKSADVKNVRTPTLLLLGQQDLRVPYHQGFGYYRALRILGVETKLIVYPKVGHQFGTVAANSDSIVQSAIWFLSHLQNDEKLIKT